MGKRIVLFRTTIFLGFSGFKILETRKANVANFKEQFTNRKTLVDCTFIIFFLF